MRYFDILKGSVESLGGTLLTSEQIMKETGLVNPDSLSPEIRAALRTDIESAIRENNAARNSSLRAAAHHHIF